MPNLHCSYADVARAAVALVGSAHHRDIAHLLGPYHPDGARESLDARLVRRWSTGARAVPEWVAGALVTILKQDATALLTAAAALENTTQERTTTS